MVVKEAVMETEIVLPVTCLRDPRHITVSPGHGPPWFSLPPPPHSPPPHPTPQSPSSRSGVIWPTFRDHKSVMRCPGRAVYRHFIQER